MASLASSLMVFCLSGLRWPMAEEGWQEGRSAAASARALSSGSSLVLAINTIRKIKSWIYPNTGQYDTALGSLIGYEYSSPGKRPSEIDHSLRPFSIWNCSGSIGTAQQRGHHNFFFLITSTTGMAQQTLDGDLKALLTAIEGLPPSFQSGRRSDPLGTYLTPGLSDDGDPKPVFPVDEDGLYGTFNTAWERVFQKCPSDADDKLKKLVHHGRGKHGLILAHAGAEHYATVVTSDERALIQLRAQTLLALIRANIGPTVNGGKISHLKSGLAVGINFADFIKIRGT
ncbi:hypothetical protein GGX14DRAFT_392236 [Mycena pura]|uniref:Uncharacterized protein n=1 Tax=Mycena pura TaxID=153505 RepID=A0AAD6VJT4_9AGAR|nr:hypothetical protein GGX14DRAFT_392236 [Mycena pura]